MAHPAPPVDVRGPHQARQIVVISEPERHAPIRGRFAPTTAVELFAVADLSRALSFAVVQRPEIVVLDAGFACTVRGRSLINTLLKNRTLAGCEIRVVTAADGGGGAFDLDPACRRSEERVTPTGIAVQIDGTDVTLADLSTRGAQILSPLMVKPSQRLRVTLAHADATARAAATVVWATFEMPVGEAPRYRAGLEFAEAAHAGTRRFLERLGLAR